ncbi:MULTISPECIES: AraC family transcriptional regulator [Sphingobium]|uniref:AraC family transcriptional regulator n=1 Tax=Sphingobium TaxID=165695 RepID=UPI00159C0C63|nr:AraC family transcriptional regulator [Sphingobium sp. 15-1]
MDPLSDVLSLLKPRRELHASGFEAGPEWALAFPAHEGIKCYAIASGRCWLTVQEESQPILLEAGDCFFTTRGLPFILASDLALVPEQALEVFAGAKQGGFVSYRGRGAFSLAGGHFRLESDHAGLLLGLLPSVVRVRDESGRAVLRWCLDQLIEEIRSRRPGVDLVAQHLAHMMLVQALRLFVADDLREGAGWLFALADRQIGLAIELMHEQPARRWSLEDLAAAVGMSRSSFAVRFKDKVRLSPMDYLTRWRMLKAGDELRTTDQLVATIGRSLGYESESSFSTAFKRVMGCTPRDYARRDADASVHPQDRLAGANHLRLAAG